MGFILGIILVVLFLNELNAMAVDVDHQEVVETPENKTACYKRYTELKGHIFVPDISKHEVTCVWEIVVHKGFAIQLEFQMFNLPFSQHHVCDSYVEITYGNRDDPTKQMFCPTYKAGRILTGSRKVIVRYQLGSYKKKDDEPFQYGFEISYLAVPVSRTSKFNNQVVTILLLTMACILFIAICAFCFRIRSWVKARNKAASIEIPNAPTREELQAAFEFRRRSLRQKSEKEHKLDFSIFQSQSSSGQPNFARWSSVSHLPRVVAAEINRPHTEKPVSYASTPKSVFPAFSRKWSDSNTEKIERLRTKLVARFSSSSSNENTSDISLYYSANSSNPNWGRYLQVSNEEEGGVDNLAHEADDEMADTPTPQRIPSIVIEFVN